MNNACIPGPPLYIKHNCENLKQKEKAVVETAVVGCVMHTCLETRLNVNNFKQ